MRPTVLSMTDVIGDLRMLVDRLTGTNVKLDLEFGRDLWPVKTDLGPVRAGADQPGGQCP
jgi:two-component system cell cycle sensor histidine kinase/response regulator CckA